MILSEILIDLLESTGLYNEGDLQSSLEAEKSRLELIMKIMQVCA